MTGVLIGTVVIGAVTCTLEWLWTRGVRRAQERLSEHDSRYGWRWDETPGDVLRSIARGGRLK